MNIAMSWQQWLTAPNKSPVFFMLNSLAQPDPVDLFYTQDWVEQAFPLYSDTQMNHLLAQSPWLVRPKLGCLSMIAHQLDRHALSDISWGWAYRSDNSWSQQLNHWRSRQLVILREKQVVFRLMDARIFSSLFPAMTDSDWSGLLTPVSELMIGTPEPHIYYRTESCDQSGSDKPFVLEHHLIQAWYRSTYALQGLVFALSSHLWENHGGLAEKLDAPKGKLQEQITDWLRYRLASGDDIGKLTSADYLQTLNEQ